MQYKQSLHNTTSPARVVQDIRELQQISLPSLHDHDVKMPNFTLFFLSLSKLKCGPQEIISREIPLNLTFSVNWNKRDNFEFSFLK